MRNAVAFVLGFSPVFILFGLFAGFFGMLLGPWRIVLGQAAGGILVLFGLTMLGVRIPLLSGERHVASSRLGVGRVESSFFIGALFALGWSPCIGPILGTILLFASQSATALQGAALLAVFSVGLGIPFLLTAYALESAGKFFVRIGPLTQALSVLGGVVLIGVGLLMLTGLMGAFVAGALRMMPWGYDALLNYL